MGFFSIASKTFLFLFFFCFFFCFIFLFDFSTISLFSASFMKLFYQQLISAIFQMDSIQLQYSSFSNLIMRMVIKAFYKRSQFHAEELNIPHTDRPFGDNYRKAFLPIFIIFFCLLLQNAECCIRKLEQKININGAFNQSVVTLKKYVYFRTAMIRAIHEKCLLTRMSIPCILRTFNQTFN